MKNLNFHKLLLNRKGSSEKWMENCNFAPFFKPKTKTNIK